MIYGLVFQNKYCPACESASWRELTDCADCEDVVCYDCGDYDGDELLCKTCLAKRQAERADALEMELASEPTNTLWEDYEENWVEMTEFRLPPARASSMQMELDFSAEVA